MYVDMVDNDDIVSISYTWWIDTNITEILSYVCRYRRCCIDIDITIRVFELALCNCRCRLDIVTITTISLISNSQFILDMYGVSKLMGISMGYYKFSSCFEINYREFVVSFSTLTLFNALLCLFWRDFTTFHSVNYGNCYTISSDSFVATKTGPLNGKLYISLNIYSYSIKHWKKRHIWRYENIENVTWQFTKI